ncbi:MAG: dihydropteroate synthase [Syntrophales bacterium]|jgi:dihydropteroate synthase|nr:dihydropteroate synthase [Syntrophales bacterium]
MKEVNDDNLLFRTSRREIVLGERTLIMGIINATPDSFSDGGRYASPQKAIEEGMRMVEEGADILDIGGESTRPGSDAVSVEEELTRVIPVIRGLAAKLSIPLSIDTMKAEVAREALRAGAEIINDVSSLNYDEAMAKTISAAGAGVVLMHMRGIPKVMQQGDLTYPSLLDDIAEFLQERMERALSEGIGRTQTVIDPGIGFGKTADDNLRLIRHLGEFKKLGRPILMGVSRKAFIGKITGGLPAERMEGTAAAVTASIMGGAHIVRVHDVSVMKKVVLMADAISRA